MKRLLDDTYIFSIAVGHNLGQFEVIVCSVIVLGSTTDFGTFVLLPPFLKTYLGRKKLTLGTFFRVCYCCAASLRDASYSPAHGETSCS